MVYLVAARARAYVYAGDWVADCPRGCGNVEHLYERASPRNPVSPRTVRKVSWACSYCQMTTEIDWPPCREAITAVLALRPVPHTRNWYPRDHETAVRHRVPHGQSVAELREENAQHGVPASGPGVV